jgi:hypothetical protein
MSPVAPLLDSSAPSPCPEVRRARREEDDAERRMADLEVEATSPECWADLEEEATSPR